MLQRLSRLSGPFSGTVIPHPLRSTIQHQRVEWQWKVRDEKFEESTSPGSGSRAGAPPAAGAVITAVLRDVLRPKGLLPASRSAPGGSPAGRVQPRCVVYTARKAHQVLAPPGDARGPPGGQISGGRQARAMCGRSRRRACSGASAASTTAATTSRCGRWRSPLYCWCGSPQRCRDAAGYTSTSTPPARSTGRPCAASSPAGRRRASR